MAKMSFDASMGLEVKQIAAKYHLQPGTVSDYLEEAAKFRFTEAYAATIAQQLGPLALAVYEQHLLSGNLEAARDIVFGLGILGAEKDASASREDMESITIYRLERKLNGLAAASPLPDVPVRRLPFEPGGTAAADGAPAGAVPGPEGGGSPGSGLLGAGEQRSAAGLSEQGDSPGGRALQGGGLTAGDPAAVRPHEPGGDTAPQCSGGEGLAGRERQAEVDSAAVVAPERRPALPVLPRRSGPEDEPLFELEAL